MNRDEIKNNLRKAGIITDDGTLRNGELEMSFKRLIITAKNGKLVKMTYRELDDNQIIQIVTSKNSPPWPREYVEFLEDWAGK